MKATNLKSVSQRYKQAEQYEHAMYDDSLVRNSRVYANWIDGSNHFWYRRKLKEGQEYILVDAEKGTSTEAFNHTALASALAKEANEEVDSQDLPIVLKEISLQRNEILFSAFSKDWMYSTTKNTCTELPVKPEGMLSPDGQSVIYVKAHNLWHRDIKQGKETPLTTDGTKHYAYGAFPERVALATGSPEGAFLGTWSPNSRYFFTVRTDEREVKDLPVTSYVPTDGSARPVCTPRKYALPGDEHVPLFEMLVLDTHTNEVIIADHPPLHDATVFADIFTGSRAWWHKDSSKAYFVDCDKYFKSARVIEFDITNGKCRTLFEEHADTYLELGFEYESGSSSMYLQNSNELVWWSQRSGWAHIYLYDLTTGKLKQQLTQGEWVVREVLYFDAKRREVYLQIAGRDKSKNPYYRELARVNIDTCEMNIMAEGDFDTLAYKPATVLEIIESGLLLATEKTRCVSPTGDYAVVTTTRSDSVPQTILLDRLGNIVLTLETADTSDLPSSWQWPEPVQGKAADASEKNSGTDIYGVIFKPSS